MKPLITCLRRKLHSQRGAAMMLAFLMLLLCIMVASSVLAAAASNAGKIKSNRIEQQKYMTLTSAVQLICDDLEKANYTAKYDIYEWKDENNGNEYFHIKPYPGDYSGNELNGQIPLGKWLNRIFFGAGRSGYDYSALTGWTDGPPPYECTLKVTLPDGLEGYPYPAGSPPGSPIYQVDQTVTVWVKIDENTHNIMLTAWLGEGNYDPADPVKVTAELVARKDPSPFINPHGNGSAFPSYSGLPTPGGTNQTHTVTRKVTNAEGVEIEEVIATFTTIKKETLTSMTWKLNWIKKGE